MRGLGVLLTRREFIRIFSAGGAGALYGLDEHNLGFRGLGTSELDLILEA